VTHAPLNADLHCHSTVSDGTLEPEAIAARAHAGGVELWALTDHDEMSGQHRARDAALALGMDYLAGCEISVSFARETVHIVGLGMDLDDPALIEGLARTRGGRAERAREMAESLARAGLHGTYEGALCHVGNPDLISRTHFARHLVEAGVCADVHEVFRRYLTEGKPGYVPHRWASLGDAGRYKFTPNEEYALFTEFKAHGGEGVEVVTGSHGPADFVKYAAAAREYGLCASRGSDFHSPEESHTGLGSLPPLPSDLSPVWERLAHRVHHP